MSVSVNRVREILNEAVTDNPEIGELPIASFITIYCDDVVYNRVKSGVVDVFLIEDEKPNTAKPQWSENINS